MQLVSERGNIDKLVNFDNALIQLSFHTSVFTCKRVFNPNVTTFNSVKLQRGFALSAFHFSAFHYI